MVIHGDDDQIVPIAVGGLRTAKMIKGAILKVYKGAPHGLPITLKDQLNADSSSSSREGKDRLAIGQPRGRGRGRVCRRRSA